MTIHWLMQRVSDLPEANSWLMDSERARAAGLTHDKRRTDWLLGRWTMKRALEARDILLGNPPPKTLELEIPAAPDGAPEPLLRGVRIPESISLSHRSGVAVCALAPAGTELGCDLELLEPRSRAFVVDFLTEEERRRCELATGREAVLLPNLFWSARESVLKALRLGLSVDTRRVAVNLGSRLEGDVWRPFEARFRRVAPGDPELFTGWWRRLAGNVITVASRPASEAPVRLACP